MPYPSIKDKWECLDKNGIISPYFLNIASLKFLKEGEYREVREYILWYLSMLNYPDKYGYTGTIYDFYVREGFVVSANDYDSADAYAGTFLTIVSLYSESTGDLSILHENLTKIKDVAYVILRLSDPRDGLVRSKPDLQTKFLMDNIEAYIGLSLFCKTLYLLNDEHVDYYCKHAEVLRYSIKRSFYDVDRLYWAIDENGKYEIKDFVEYPDVLAHIYWRLFTGEKIDLLHKTLTCEQIYAIEFIKTGLKHMNER